MGGEGREEKHGYVDDDYTLKHWLSPAGARKEVGFGFGVTVICYMLIIIIIIIIYTHKDSE